MNDGITMEVQFTQTVTLHPPEHIQDPLEAEYWFNADPEDRLLDGIDLYHGEIEVLEIND